MSNVYTYGIILLSLILSINSEICPKFTCGDLPNHLCTLKTSNYTYTLNNCSSTQQCPFYNFGQSDSLTCEEKNPAVITLYPGAQCQNNTDCFSNNCLDNVCTNVQNNQKCSLNSECNYGYSCRLNTTQQDTLKYLSSDTNQEDKYCLPQLNEGAECASDYECVNTHGCYNSTCVPYFSLPNGHPIENDPPVALSFCQSGYQYNNTCDSLVSLNPDVECSESEPCTYTNYIGDKVIKPENCLCGYNPLGTKHCKLGSEHNNYKEYIVKLKSLIQDFSHCNTLERGVCNENKRRPNQEYTYLSNNYTNAMIEAVSHTDLVDADSCVIDVVYPQFVPSKPGPTPPTPSNTCAKYECKSNEDSCAFSHYDTNKTETDVVLSSICNSTSYCNIGGSPNIVFYNKTDVTGKCTKKPHNIVGVRYPGEECNFDTDCFSPDKSRYTESLVGTCLYGVCRGYNETESCQETAWCWKGLYCDNSNMTSPTCAKLKSSGSECKKSNECQNNLLCFEGKCESVWYSQSVGKNVSAIGDSAPEHYCKFGKSYNGICDYLNTTDAVDSQSGLVKCEVGQLCNYTSTSGASTKMCECGYNPDGLSYCPMGNNQSKFLYYLYAIIIYAYVFNNILTYKFINTF